ncbi:MAG: polysaccharide deacetylase family protein [Proteobacteria bacterium]|nr:polysaccharide deacetylase family protein [Pseudomonadota bacterium]
MPIGGKLKTAIARGWSATRRLRPSRPRLTILYYHAVPAADAALFDRHMAWLAANANIVPADHEGPLDPRRLNVAVTFDDAFQSVMDHALPALRKHNIPTTIFVPTGWLGQTPGWQMETDADRAERVMDAAALRSLPKELFRFGSHTVSHPRLSRLDRAGRLRELRDSRAALEELFGGPIDTLAFPYGDHDDPTLDDAKAAGYRFVYSILPEDVPPAGGGLLRGRTAVDAHDPMDLFRLKAEGAFAWLPVAIRVKRMVRGALGRA